MSWMKYLNENEDEMIARLLDESIDNGFEHPQYAFEVEDETDFQTIFQNASDETIIDGEYTVIEDSDEIEISPDMDLRPERERHRCKLKLGKIPYNVAWTNGFYHKRGGKILYKKGSRMRKAFEAGRSAGSQ